MVGPGDPLALVDETTADDRLETMTGVRPIAMVSVPVPVAVPVGVDDDPAEAEVGAALAVAALED
jgi:hypothetical protein